METIITTAIGIIIGGLITYFVSKSFYEKTEKVKALQPFVRFITNILSDIDPEVKKRLKVSYAEQPIEKMYQMEFVIANTGDIPITNIIKPLSLSIPNNGQLLDVNILHVEPSEREIGYKINDSKNGSQSVDFIFPLLNSCEYFVVKLLIKGEIPKSEKSKEDEDEYYYENYNKVISMYEFNITAPDLKPTLTSTRLPHYYENEFQLHKVGFDWGTMIGISVLILMILSMSFMLYSLNNITTGYYLFKFKEFFHDFNLIKLTVIIGWLIDVFLVVILIVLGIQELPSIRKKPKPKFQLPKKLRNNLQYDRWM